MRILFNFFCLVQIQNGDDRTKSFSEYRRNCTITSVSKTELSGCNDSLKDATILQGLPASEKSKLLVMIFNLEITCIHCCL